MFPFPFMEPRLSRRADVTCYKPIRDTYYKRAAESWQLYKSPRNMYVRVTPKIIAYVRLIRRATKLHFFLRSSKICRH